ncbi:leucine-rich repeat-containing protein 74A isoform X2 [Hemicordylus capensis]|uniref:leucine-rich repeat-containing protein 74A isoform X2 n=1 Tax=Hemicordylus capensis TaxID=884348 RepID=UPI0023024F3B|nr:leucine-rich repeat-containing protein 74A isoform X2 [Hemicordylus capensis]
MAHLHDPCGLVLLNVLLAFVCISTYPKITTLSLASALDLFTGSPGKLEVRLGDNWRLLLCLTVISGAAVIVNNKTLSTKQLRVVGSSQHTSGKRGLRAKQHISMQSLDQYGEMSGSSTPAETRSLTDATDNMEEKEKDENSDTDLEIEDVERSFTNIKGADLYIEACKLVGVVPVSYFIRNMEEPIMNLNHHGLGTKGTKALAIALVNISNNRLDTDGAEAICRMFFNNISNIRAIQLAGNNFNDESAIYFSESLMTNYRVTELDLSHNEFAEKGGELLGQMLANNESLEVLNLSWNHLRMKGAVAFSAGLRANGTLKILDLAWNGFGNEGALALGEALKVNNVLTELDISSNHINNEGTVKLCKGLEVNGNLRILKMAHNPMTVTSAIALVTVVRKNSKSRIEEINISNVLVNEGFIKLLDLVCEIRPELDVIFGGVGGHFTKKQEQRPDAMKLIQNYLDAHKLRLWDFFRNMDKDGNMKIPVADFRRAMMQQSKIPLDRIQVRELIRKLDNAQTGHVDYSRYKVQEPVQEPKEEEVEEV